MVTLDHKVLHLLLQLLHALDLAVHQAELAVDDLDGRVNSGFLQLDGVLGVVALGLPQVIEEGVIGLHDHRLL